MKRTSATKLFFGFFDLQQLAVRIAGHLVQKRSLGNYCLHIKIRAQRLKKNYGTESLEST